MPRANQNEQLVRAAVEAFRRLPPAGKVAVGVLGLIGVAAYLMSQAPPAAPTHPTAANRTVGGTAPDGSGRYLFCWWNVENLFDDQDDKRRSVDEEYDDPFAHDAKLRDLKYDRIASALLHMNGGAGPDVIACCEVESVRAAKLLRETLNGKIADPAKHYTDVAMRDLDAGRHIAPAVISRLPTDGSRTRLLASRLRILETHLTVNGHDLCIVASHWTSQLRQRDGSDGDEGRNKYAEVIRGFVAKQPADADLLLCGDFNDTPESEPVRDALGAVGDPAATKPPHLLDLVMGKSPDRFGTLYYNSKPLIYDHVCVSAGLLDRRGWGCDPNTVRVDTDGLIRPGSTRRQPWRFGNPLPAVKDSERGFSDHFPVTVELTVAPPGIR